jgi:hypothetical protein
MDKNPRRSFCAPFLCSPLLSCSTTRSTNSRGACSLSRTGLVSHFGSAVLRLELPILALRQASGIVLLGSKWSQAFPQRQSPDSTPGTLAEARKCRSPILPVLAWNSAEIYLLDTELLLFTILFDVLSSSSS